MFFFELPQDPVPTKPVGTGMKKEIVKTIQGMSGRYTPYSIFTDWIAMTAIAIQNGCYMIHDSIWQQREEKYLAIINKYTPEEQKKFCELCGMLTATMEESEMTDWLGEIYMESGCGNKNTGQFFTPFHLSYLTAQGVLGDVDEEHPVYLNEPSTGGGGMIIAAAKVLRDRGLNYQKCMKVVAQDLDWNGVYMTYIQLSLLGIDAIVAQGDTLCEPYVLGYPRERVFYTPRKMGVIL